MPRAEEKSVPVFFSACIAARQACTIATLDTSENTGIIHLNMKDSPGNMSGTDWLF
jgi:hypothetical protein